ncbi:hypothetical protein D9758_006655 [Tetrapyrgos nigripes]|uniref:Uncharacterized protein n=1 Tax=Tetrapyrgos nigripes TaxID=182062 RepID=A0A8H5LQ96_9AGAR|nr:hypothetical protein D9758_006655 [Tetrapyrgos nigripes]
MKQTSATHFKFHATAAIFGLDGTLTDSTPEVAAASSSHNSGVSTPALTPDDSPSTSRRSSISSVSSISSIASAEIRCTSFGVALQKSLSQLSNNQHNECLTTRTVDSTPVCRRPGARALLESLPEGKFGVVSFGSLDYVHDCMSRAGLPHPKVTVTAKDSEGQEIQAISLAAIRMDGASLCLPAQCAVFVNSPEGIQEAIADGAGTIVAVCDTYSHEELEEHRPHYVVDGLEAVKCTVLESGELEFDVWVTERVSEKVSESRSPMKREALPKLQTRNPSFRFPKPLSPSYTSPLPRLGSVFSESLPDWLRNADVWDEE